MSTDNNGAPRDSGRDSTRATPARITATERRRRKEAEGARLRAQGLSTADIAGARLPGPQLRAQGRQQGAGVVLPRPTDAARLLAMNRLDALRLG